MGRGHRARKKKCKSQQPESNQRPIDFVYIPLQSIALPTEKHSSFGCEFTHRKTMLGRMSLELARINRCLETWNRRNRDITRNAKENP